MFVVLDQLANLQAFLLFLLSIGIINKYYAIDLTEVHRKVIRLELHLLAYLIFIFNNLWQI